MTCFSFLPCFFLSSSNIAVSPQACVSVCVCVVPFHVQRVWGGNREDREVVPCSSRFRKIPLIGETFLLFFTLARLAFFLKIRLHYSDYTELNTQNSRHFSSAFDPALEKVPAGRHSLCVTNRFFVSHVVFVVVGGFFSHSEAPNYHPNQQTDQPRFTGIKTPSAIRRTRYPNACTAGNATATNNSSAFNRGKKW